MFRFSKKEAATFEVSRRIDVDDLNLEKGEMLPAKVATRALRTAWSLLLEKASRDSHIRTMRHPADTALRAVLVYQDEIQEAVALDRDDPENSQINAQKVQKLGGALKKLTRRSGVLRIPPTSSPVWYDGIDGGKRIVLPILHDTAPEAFDTMRQERTEYLDVIMTVTGWQPSTLQRPVGVPVAELAPDLQAREAEWLLSNVTNSLARTSLAGCMLRPPELFEWSPSLPDAPAAGEGSP